jgi:hypothetical protein
VDLIEVGQERKEVFRAGSHRRGTCLQTSSMTANGCSVQYDAEEAWIGSVRDWLNRFD